LNIFVIILDSFILQNTLLFLFIRVWSKRIGVRKTLRNFGILGGFISGLEKTAKLIIVKSNAIKLTEITRKLGIANRLFAT